MKIVFNCKNQKYYMISYKEKYQKNVSLNIKNDKYYFSFNFEDQKLFSCEINKEDFSKIYMCNKIFDESIINKYILKHTCYLFVIALFITK